MKKLLILLILLSIILTTSCTKSNIVIPENQVEIYCPSPNRPMIIELRKDIPLKDDINIKILVDDLVVSMGYSLKLEEVIECYRKSVKLNKK